MQASNLCDVIAIASRNAEQGKLVADRLNIPVVYDSYDKLLSDPQIDAVYIPLPNHLHVEWAIKSLQAGKHVLCEKPFASNTKEALEMARAANETGKVLSEGFAYRYHPLTSRIKEIMHSGELGKLKRIEARFCFLLPIPPNPSVWG